ncbi:MAG: alpha/beta hydrolase [Chloroflexota bacterium]
MSEQYFPVKSSFAQIEKKNSWNGIQGMLYEPSEPTEKRQVAIIVMHSDVDYLAHPTAIELAKRGYRTLGTAVSDRDNPLDEKLLDVQAARDYLRKIPGVRKVITLGHSGGATLMSAFQNAAENGVQALQGSEKLIPCSDLGELSPADGVMLLDSNYGNGAMTLLSLDPAVTCEDSGKKVNSEFDLFDPANGYDPKGSTYTDEFIRKYQQAQGARNNRLIDAALERLYALESGRGNYSDDEPFIVPGAAQYAFNNKLFPQDTRLLSRTHNAWPLLHADGSVTNQIIPCVRLAKNNRSFTDLYRSGSIRSTVRTYLNSSAVRTTDQYGYNEDSLFGIDWLSSYNCTPGNITGVSAPLLMMGMTGGYEFLASEIVHENAMKCQDKTIAFVEGATHNFETARECEAYPGQFGDTMKTMCDYIDMWLSQKGRFID